MSIINKLICAFDKVIRTSWCTPDDLDDRIPSDERREGEIALRLRDDHDQHRDRPR